MKQQKETVTKGSALGGLALAVGIVAVMAAPAGYAADKATVVKPRITAEEDDVVRLKSLDELKALIEKKEIATVMAFDFKGKEYVVDPQNAKAEPATFPVEAKAIRRPISLTVVPYQVNPDCILVYQASTHSWVRFCR